MVVRYAEFETGSKALWKKPSQTQFNRKSGQLKDLQWKGTTPCHMRAPTVKHVWKMTGRRWQQHRRKGWQGWHRWLRWHGWHGQVRWHGRHGWLRRHGQVGWHGGHGWDGRHGRHGQLQRHLLQKNVDPIQLLKQNGTAGSTHADDSREDRGHVGHVSEHYCPLMSPTLGPSTLKPNLQAERKRD